MQRCVKERMQKIKYVYSDFTPKQYQKIEEIIFEQVTKEVITKEYYGYDNTISWQKVNATKYVFERKYKDYIKSINN